MNQRLELRAEFLDAGNDWHCTRIAQHANSGSCHVVGNRKKGVEIFHRSLTVANPLDNLRCPCCTFAALGALAAALMREESSEPGNDAHHRLLFIDDDYTARAKHGALRYEAF